MYSGPKYDACSKSQKDKILFNRKHSHLYHSTIHRQRHRRKKQNTKTKHGESKNDKMRIVYLFKESMRQTHEDK